MESGKSASSSCSSPLAGQGGWLLKLFRRKAFSDSRRSGRTSSSASVHSTNDDGRANCFQSKEDIAQEERISVDHLMEEVQLLRQRLENEEEEMQKLRLEVSSLRLHEIRARNENPQQESETNLSPDDVALSQTNGVNQHGSEFGNYNQSQEKTAQLARLHDHIQTIGTKTLDRRELTRGYVDEIDAGQKVTECVKNVINSRQLCLSSIPIYEPDNFYTSGEAKEIVKDSRSPPQSTDDPEDLLFRSSLADKDSSPLASPVKSNSRTSATTACTVSTVAPADVINSRKLQSEIFRSLEDSELASHKVTRAPRDLQTPAPGTPPEHSPENVTNNCYSQSTPKSRRTATKFDADDLDEVSRTTEMLQSDAELERLLKTMQRLRREEMAMEKSNEIPSWSSLKSVAASNPQPLPTPQLVEAGQKVSSRDSKSSIIPWIERGTAQSKLSSRYSRDPSKNSASDNLKDAADYTAIRSAKMYSSVPVVATEARHGSLSRSSSSSATGTSEILNHSQHNGNLRRSHSTVIPRTRARSKEFSSEPDETRGNFPYSSENPRSTAGALASAQVGDLEDEVRQCLEQSRLLLSDSSETESWDDDEDKHERKLSRETSFSVLTLARQRRRSTGECTYKDDKRKQPGEQVQAIRLKEKETTDAEVTYPTTAEFADKNLVTITPHRLRDAIGSWDKKRSNKNVQVSSPQSVSSGRSRFYWETISPIILPT